MILRRLIDHVKAQHWTAVFLDLIIVVLGVFIGLQANNWNQYAGDRRAEAEYLRQLQGDLHNIEAEIDAQIKFEQFHANLAGDVFNLIRNDFSETRTLKISMGLNELNVRRTLRTQSPTFLNLQGSGKLDIISDPELRAAIIAYFYGSSRLEAALDKNNAFFIDQGFNKFVRRKNIPSRKWDAGLMNLQLPPSATVLSPFAETAEKSPLYAAGGAVLSAPPDAEIWEEIVSQLSWRGTIAISNEGIAQNLKAATEDLEAKLKRHFERRAP